MVFLIHTELRCTVNHTSDEFGSRHLDSNISCAQTKTFFFPQTNCNIRLEEPECITTVFSNSILAPIYPSRLKFSARTLHPFLSHSLLATLPASTLHWALFFFSLFLSCSKGIKMGLINSKSTSVCITKFDVIKDLIPLPLSLFHPSPELNHPMSITSSTGSSYIGLKFLRSLSSSHHLDSCFVCS